VRRISVDVLGPLDVRRDGRPVAVAGAKPRAVLTLLGLYAGRVVTGETLLSVLWGDDPPRTAHKALQTHVSTLRRALGPDVVVTAGTGWRLVVDSDATRFGDAVRAGREQARAGDHRGAVAAFDAALTLWRGAPELCDAPRGRSEVASWVERHRTLTEDRFDALLATGRSAEVVGELELAVAATPLRERRWAQLCLALYRSSRQADALVAYQRARSLLAQQLGVEPAPELRALHHAILTHSPELGIKPAVPGRIAYVMRNRRTAERLYPTLNRC